MSNNFVIASVIGGFLVLLTTGSVFALTDYSSGASHSTPAAGSGDVLFKHRASSYLNSRVSRFISSEMNGSFVPMYLGLFSFLGEGGVDTANLTGSEPHLIRVLNDAIMSSPANSLGLTFALSGSRTSTPVTVPGHTVAPEPVSMALVGAGLVGLPFARRLRKLLRG